MKLFLNRDEVWPVYALYTVRHIASMVEANMSEADYADYKAACAAYEEWQGRLMQIWKARERNDER